MCLMRPQEPGLCSRQGRVIRVFGFDQSAAPIQGGAEHAERLCLNGTFATQLR